MNSRQRFGLAAGFVAVAAAGSLVYAPSLPDQIVTHWTAGGEPDATMPKAIGLALLPALTAGLLVVFALIPRIDPLRENVAEFRASYDWFVVVFTAFMTVIHLGVVAFNLGYDFDFTQLVQAATVVLFLYLGLLLDRAERNWFIGIRTPWTLSSPEVWDRTHRLASRLFLLTAASATVGLAFGDYAVYFIAVPAVLAAVVSVAYSYVLYERLEAAERVDTEVGP